MNTWVTDNVPLAGAVSPAHRRSLPQRQADARRVMIRGERVDVSRIHANLLTVIADGDHITPACQSEPIMSKVSSPDKELFRISGGHIGIMAGSGAAEYTGRTSMAGWPRVRDDGRAA